MNRRYCGYEIFPLLSLFRQSVKLAEVNSWMAERFVSVNCRARGTRNSHREPSLLKSTLQKRLRYVVTTVCISFHLFDFIENVGAPDFVACHFKQVGVLI
jgi:hypothetical protein